MNIIEAAKAMNEGKKVRQCGYETGNYIEAAKSKPIRAVGSGFEMRWKDGSRFAILDTCSLLAEDWEVME